MGVTSVPTLTRPHTLLSCHMQVVKAGSRGHLAMNLSLRHAACKGALRDLQIGA